MVTMSNTTSPLPTGFDGDEYAQSSYSSISVSTPDDPFASSDPNVGTLTDAPPFDFDGTFDGTAWTLSQAHCLGDGLTLDDFSFDGVFSP